MPKPGVLVGIEELHIALMLTNDDASTTWDTPEKVLGFTTFQLNTNASSEDLWADNISYTSAATVGSRTAEIGVVGATYEQRATILGHVINATTKAMEKFKKDQSPFLAVGFKELLDNGKYNYVWITMCRALEPDRSGESGSDAINFQQNNITFAAVDPLNPAIPWMYEVAEEAVGSVPLVLTNWFNQVIPTAI